MWLSSHWDRSVRILDLNVGGGVEVGVWYKRPEEAVGVILHILMLAQFVDF